MPKKIESVLGRNAGNQPRYQRRNNRRNNGGIPVVNSQMVILSAPDSQVFRAELAATAIREGQFDQASKHLVEAAKATIGSDWSKQCAKLAETCLVKWAESAHSQRKTAIAALLHLAGRRQRADIIDITAAIHLAGIHLDRGHSAARSLQEGNRMLQGAVLPINRATPLVHASSGR